MEMDVDPSSLALCAACSKELVLEVLPYLCLAAEWTLVGTSAYVTALRKKARHARSVYKSHIYVCDSV